MTNKTGECGGFFYTPNGVLTSPSYPDNYPSYSECIYIISQPTGTILRLNFLKLDIEWVSHCTFDFVDVRDGPSDMAWQRWPNMYCGNEIPAPFQSTVNHVWIMWVWIVLAKVILYYWNILLAGLSLMVVGIDLVSWLNTKQSRFNLDCGYWQHWLNISLTKIKSKCSEIFSLLLIIIFYQIWGKDE